MSIQRYSHNSDSVHHRSTDDPDPDGEWVRYVDHAQRELEHAKELRDLSERLAAALDLLEGIR